MPDAGIVLNQQSDRSRAQVEVFPDAGDHTPRLPSREMNTFFAAA